MDKSSSTIISETDAEVARLHQEAHALIRQREYWRARGPLFEAACLQERARSAVEVPCEFGPERDAAPGTEEREVEDRLASDVVVRHGRSLLVGAG
jgi:hypothetical protein